MSNPTKPNSGQEKKDSEPEGISLPAILQTLMFHRTCVAYIGAGFSMACGMPDWKGLINRLIEYGEKWIPEDKLRYVQAALNGDNLPLAASILQSTLAPSLVNDCLNDTFGTVALARAGAIRQGRMRERMDKLVQADWAGIVTTNYDRLIEQALGEANAKTDWLPDIQIDGEASRFCEVLSAAREDRRFFVKLHGSISGARVVLSTQDYDETYLRSPQVTIFLQSLMLQYHLVFIGCSLEDEIIRIRRKLTADFKGLIPIAFAVLPNTELNVARSEVLRTEASIQPIWYLPDRDHTGVDDILGKFATLTKQPDALRSLTKFRSLLDRFTRIPIGDQQLLAYIDQRGRKINLQTLEDQLTDDDKLRQKLFSLEWQGEITYRIFYLLTAGLLWQKNEIGGELQIPTELSSEDIQKHAR